MNMLSKRAIENRYGVAIPAGLGNLSYPNQAAIRSEHDRMIEKIRAKLKAGEEIVPEDLRRCETY
jgi:hypothetical protein